MVLVFGLFHFAQCFLGPSEVWHLSGLHSFSRPSNIPCVVDHSVLFHSPLMHMQVPAGCCRPLAIVNGAALDISHKFPCKALLLTPTLQRGTYVLLFFFFLEKNQ